MKKEPGGNVLLCQRPPSGDGGGRVFEGVFRRDGFTVIELLTLLGVLGVVATLAVSAVHSARTTARQITCSNNLQTIGSAVSEYELIHRHRARSLSRVYESMPGEKNPSILLCPADPALRRSKTPTNLKDLAWGNMANDSQDPGIVSRIGGPESGSWQNELQERQESMPFSYLHPLGWSRSAWDRLQAGGPPTGISVCQLHGVRVPAASANPDHRTYMDYEGRLLRVQTDGSVVKRKIFRGPGVGSGAETTALPRPPDYPWEFYTDRGVAPLK